MQPGEATDVKMAMRTDNIMTLVSISSAINSAGANEYLVAFSGTAMPPVPFVPLASLTPFMTYVFVELHR